LRAWIGAAGVGEEPGAKAKSNLQIGFHPAVAERRSTV